MANAVALTDPSQRFLARKVAILVARQKSTAEIARELSCSEDTVRKYKKSPLFQEMVAIIEERITQAGVDEVVKELVEDSKTNFAFIRAVRDGAYDDKADRLSVRLRAATYLGDKLVPDAGNGPENIDRAIQVVVNGRLLGQMVGAMKDDDAVVDAEFEPLGDDPLTLPRTPEEFIKRFIVENDDDDD